MVAFIVFIVVSFYLNSCGERFDPCTATWHVVQF